MDLRQLDIDRGALQRVVGDGQWRISRESQGSSDVELMDVEILDSEEEMNPDDPFKVFNAKRPATAPAGATRETATVPKKKKRPATEPSSTRSSKRKALSLLEILLPENYDLTVSQNDFSALHCSTQATEHAETSAVDIALPKLRTVPEHAFDDDTKHDDDEAQIQLSGNDTEEDTDKDSQSDKEEESDSDDSEPELLGMEKIDPDSTVPEERGSVSSCDAYDAQSSNHGVEEEKEKEKESVKTIKRPQFMQPIEIHVQDPPETTVSQLKDVSETSAGKGYSSEPLTTVPLSTTGPLAHHSSNISIPPSATTEQPEDAPRTSSRTSTPEPRDPPTKKRTKHSTHARPSKHKSTLEELCSKTTQVPYRVGLSKRANINHLHPNLKKK